MALSTVKSNIGKTGVCPACRNNFTIPDEKKLMGRQHQRAIVAQNKFAQQKYISQVSQAENIAYHIVYTEVNPLTFVRKQTELLPLLDISEGGIQHSQGVETRYNK